MFGEVCRRSFAPFFSLPSPQQQVPVSRGGSAGLGGTRGVCQPLHGSDQPAHPIAGGCKLPAPGSLLQLPDTCPGHADTKIVLCYTTGRCDALPPLLGNRNRLQSREKQRKTSPKAQQNKEAMDKPQTSPGMLLKPLRGHHLPSLHPVSPGTILSQVVPVQPWRRVLLFPTQSSPLGSAGGGWFGGTGAAPRVSSPPLPANVPTGAGSALVPSPRGAREASQAGL